MAGLDHIVRNIPTVDTVVDLEADGVAGKPTVLHVVDPAIPEAHAGFEREGREHPLKA